jgi:hypothetical protein
MTIRAYLQRLTRWITPQRYVLWALPLLMLLTHRPVLELDIVGVHSWRQTMTASMARAFHREDTSTWLAPKQADRLMEDGVHLFEVPVLQWLISVAWDVFCEQVLVLRLLMFGISWLSVWATYGIARRLLANDWLGAWAATALAFSPLFFYYSWNPMPDNLALCLALWALWGYLRHWQTQKWPFLVLMGLCGMFAVLVKFPFIIALFVAGLHALSAMPWRQWRTQTRQWLAASLPAVVLLLAVVPGYLWYGIYIKDNWYAQVMLFAVHENLPYPQGQALVDLLKWNLHT